MPYSIKFKKEVFNSIYVDRKQEEQLRPRRTSDHDIFMIIEPRIPLRYPLNRQLVKLMYDILWHINYPSTIIFLILPTFFKSKSSRHNGSKPFLYRSYRPITSYTQLRRPALRYISFSFHIWLSLYNRNAIWHHSACGSLAWSKWQSICVRFGCYFCIYSLNRMADCSILCLVLSMKSRAKRWFIYIYIQLVL